MLSPDLAHIRTFEVVPKLPEPLRPLLKIAHNLWWTWHPEAVELFVRLDRSLWTKYHHNPVKLLSNCSQEQLNIAAHDDGYLSSMQRVLDNFQRHVQRTPWHAKIAEGMGEFTIGYFCAEFGLSECLQAYSGGLGCLAGDHLKSASELGLPLVAVGLLYRHGYFQQYLNADGWQQEYYEDLDFANMPLKPVVDKAGKHVHVHITLPGRDVHIALWKVIVGRIPLYLLDTNLPENEPDDRGITGQLYGGDMELRIKQEIVLGIGGVRALVALGIEPDVFHMNEGHSAFLALERVRRLIHKYDISFDEARHFSAAGNIFTTHTPVPAGIDRFPPEMVQRYFRHYHPLLKLDLEGLLALGREDVFNKNELFSMAVLAVRTSDWANAVSKLHGNVSRSMWQNIWPRVPQDEVPIQHITNGVHAPSWLSTDLIYLLDRYLGPRWQANLVDHQVWQAVNEVPDEELWRVHVRRRQRLIVWARHRLCQQLEARGTSAKQAREIADAMDPEALTIGFARRFATYKRGNLMLRDPQRLLKMLTDTQRPIQFLIAGKAHPADSGGKDFIRQLVHFARESDAAHKLVFIENYDIDVARNLVQGCDVWMNTPRRGMEASGTSGMKAALNGVLNCSILDGWWDEAYESDLGWAIGRGENYANLDLADDIESHSLHDLLEKQIVPLFYDRDDHGIPRGWIRKMKASITRLAPVFNTNRMVQEYLEKLYLPALRRARILGENNLRRSIERAHFVDRLRAAWDHLSIDDVQADTGTEQGVQDDLDVVVTVTLGDLNPDDIRVQIYVGLVDNDGRIAQGRSFDLAHKAVLGDGRHRFIGHIRPQTSGHHGFAVRIVPGGQMVDSTQLPGLIFWDRQAPPVAETKPVVEKVA